MDKSLKRLAILIAIAGIFVGIAASMPVVYGIAGSMGVLWSLIFFPYTFAYFPLYTLFVYGSWNLLLLNYGSIALSWILLLIAENREKQPQFSTENPSTQPVPTKRFMDSPMPVVILLAISGLILVSVISSLARSMSAPELTVPSNQKKFALTKTPPVYFHACVTNSTIRVRKGPGTEYETIGGLISGTCMALLGRNQDSSWVYMVADDNTVGWVAVELLTIKGEVSKLSVRATLSIPKP